MVRSVFLRDIRKEWKVMSRYEVVYFGVFFFDDKEEEYIKKG